MESTLLQGDNKVEFLYKFAPGVAEKSFGIYVA